MTLQDLIDQLQDLADDCDAQSTEVRLAIQPRWAFEHSISTVEIVGPTVSEKKRNPDAPSVIYIAEGNQIGYLPTAAGVALGWSEDPGDDDDDDDADDSAEVRR